MGLGYVEGVTHDCVRHGTTTLLAAPDIATGAVFTECKPRHRHQEFVASCPDWTSASRPNSIHLIVDNYATHKHSRVRTWLAQRPRYQIHYTPTYSSWLNQVERWFALITQRAIRRGSFRSVKELVEKIDPSSSITIALTGRSSGLQPPTLSSAKSSNFVHVFLGLDNRRLC